MDATVSIHLASIYASRIAGHRLRTSQCLRVPAASELVHPGYRVGDALWTDIHVNASGAETDLHLRLLTTPQHLGGERRWFACPRCGRRVGCLYAPWITEPFCCRRCAAGRWVTAQFVGDQPSRGTALPFQQLPEEAQDRSPIAPRLHEDVDHVAVFIDCPPQILLAPLDPDEQLVQMPGVAHAAPAAPQPPCVVEPERPTPLPDRLIRHRDTPFGEEIFDIPETQAETVVEPDGVTDDFRGESVSTIAGGWLVIGLLCHPRLNLTMPLSAPRPASIAR